MAITVARRPLRSSQMALVATTGTSKIGLRINVKNDTRHFSPIGVVFFSIEETRIGDRVFLVIRRQRRVIRSQIGNFGMKRWHARNSLLVEKLRLGEP